MVTVRGAGEGGTFGGAGGVSGVAGVVLGETGSDAAAVAVTVGLGTLGSPGVGSPGVGGPGVGGPAVDVLPGEGAHEASSPKAAPTTKTRRRVLGPKTLPLNTSPFSMLTFVPVGRRPSYGGEPTTRFTAQDDGGSTLKPTRSRPCGRICVPPRACVLFLLLRGEPDAPHGGRTRRSQHRQPSGTSVRSARTRSRPRHVRGVTLPGQLSRGREGPGPARTQLNRGGRMLGPDAGDPTV